MKASELIQEWNTGRNWIKGYTRDFQQLGNLADGVSNQNVKELTVTPKSGAGVYILTGKLNNYGKGETFTVTIPYTDTPFKVSSLADKLELDCIR